MSKGLLQEAEIRKLMKFANIGAMTDGFVDRLSESGMYEDDAAIEGEMEDEEGAPAPDAGQDEPALDEPALDEPAPEGEGSEAEFGGLIQGIVDQITSWAEGAGVEVPEASVEGEDAPADPMAGEEEEAAFPPSPEMAPEDEEDGDALAEAGIELEEEGTVDEDAMINEVTRRVAARLLAAAKKSE